MNEAPGPLATNSSQPEDRNVEVDEGLEAGAHEAAVSTNATDSRPVGAIEASREPEPYENAAEGSNTGAQRQSSDPEPQSHATEPS